MARYRALQREWRARPPINQLMSAWVGYKPPEQTDDRVATPEEMAAMWGG